MTDDEQHLILTFATSSERADFLPVAAGMADAIGPMSLLDHPADGPAVAFTLVERHRAHGEPSSPLTCWVAEAGRGYGAVSAARRTKSIQYALF